MKIGKYNELAIRINEIDACLQLCDPSFDSDIIDNLQSELRAILKEVREMKLQKRLKTKENKGG